MKYIFAILLFASCSILTKTITVPGPTVYVNVPGPAVHDTFYSDVLMSDTVYVPHVLLDTIPVAIVRDTVSYYFPLAPISGDNWANMQAAINYCMVKGWPLRLTPGFFHISKTLGVVNVQGKDYGQAWIDIAGITNSQNSAGAQTWIIADFYDAPLLLLQENKGSSIKNLILDGQYKKADTIAGNQLMVDTLSWTQWDDGKCRTNRTSPYAAICIDPFSDPKSYDPVTYQMYPSLTKYYLPGMSQAGSTQINIEGCFIQHFIVGVMITPSWQWNAEMINIRDCQINTCKSAIAQTQAQSKVNTVQNCMFWGGVHTIIDGGWHWGFPRGDAMTFPHIKDINIAGFNHEFICGNPSNFLTVIEGVYAEGLFKFGDFGGNTQEPIGGASGYTQGGAVIRDSHFDFATQAPGIPTPDFYIEAAGLSWENCTVRIYNGNTKLGRITLTDDASTFRDCTFWIQPITLKTDPVYQKIRPHFFNCRWGAWSSNFQPDTAFETTAPIGTHLIYVDRSTFNGYITDPTHTVKQYDYIVAQRYNDESVPGKSMNLVYPVGVVTSISGDTCYLQNMGMGLHSGEQLPLFYNRTK